jgi:nucleotide-binding universal stress UspA family protein
MDEQDQSRKCRARWYLESVAAMVTNKYPEAHVTCDVRLGTPREGIFAAERDDRIDLVVMATHARTGLDRARSGSVAGAVVREGYAPVLLVPPHLQHVHSIMAGPDTEAMAA